MELSNPRVYLKPKTFRMDVHREIIDLRKEDALDPIHEYQRMKREAIPDRRVVPAVQRMGCFWAVQKLNRRQTDRLCALLPFFSAERLQKMVIPIISVASKISLRALDWLVINYSKKHKVVLVNHTSHLVNVYDDYRAWLKFWKRTLFDAFRRGARIYFELGGFQYSTTVAQLNFLFWTEQLGVLQYAYLHIDALENDMTQRINECRKEKASSKRAGGKRKRSELSQAPQIKCLVYRVPCTIHF